VPTIDLTRHRAWGCLLVILLLGAVIGLVVGGAYLIERFLDPQEISRRYRVPLLVSAGGLTGLWLGSMGAVRAVRQPRQPRPGPATAELRDEPPAVANMVAHDFACTREAMAATLLDLAAREYLDLEGVDPERTMCRLRDRGDAGLTPYEARLMNVLRRRAERGVVPAAALATGAGAEESRTWWRGFRYDVEADARSRGLSRDLWDRPTLWLLGILALLPAPLVGLAFLNLAAAAAAVAPGILLVAGARTRRRQRDTPAGLAAASHWLGVRRFFRDHAAFDHLPPGAVTVWEANLAYGAALDAAPLIVRSLPLGAEDARRAWSHVTGAWREVRIRYPWLWPPAWGWSPWAALLASLGAIGVAAGLLRFAVGVGWPEPAAASDPPGLVAFVRGLVIGSAALGAIAGAWGLATLVRAIAGLGGVREVRGRVLRVRTFGRSGRSPGRHFVAIDDGSADVIQAYRIPIALWGSTAVSQDADVVAEVIPALGRVRSIRDASGPGSTAPA
jgi:hypothetical protein